MWNRYHKWLSYFLSVLLLSVIISADHTYQASCCCESVSYSDSKTIDFHRFPRLVSAGLLALGYWPRPSCFSVVQDFKKCQDGHVTTHHSHELRATRSRENWSCVLHLESATAVPGPGCVAPERRKVLTMYGLSPHLLYSTWITNIKINHPFDTTRQRWLISTIVQGRNTTIWFTLEPEFFATKLFVTKAKWSELPGTKHTTLHVID